MTLGFGSSRAKALAILLLAFFFSAQNAHAQAVREIPLPKGRGYSGMAVGPDGTAYIPESTMSAIAIVKPDKTVIEARTITGSSRPQDARMGPDGNVWFVEAGANAIGVMQPDGTMLNEYATRCTPSGHLAVGSGNVLWFSQACIESGRTTSEYITRITMAGTMSLFRIGTDVDPYRGLEGLIEGPDAAIWFVEQTGHGAIGRLNPATGKYAEYLLPLPSDSASDIFLGPDGNLWFPTLAGAGYMLDRIDMHGLITQFAWTGDDGLSTLSIGPDASFWGAAGDRSVWRIELGASGITPIKLPGRTVNIYASFMTSDKNHDLWFSEYNGCAVARIDMDALFNEDFETCP